MGGESSEGFALADSDRRFPVLGVGALVGTEAEAWKTFLWLLSDDLWLKVLCTRKRGLWLLASHSQVQDVVGFCRFSSALDCRLAGPFLLADERLELGPEVWKSRETSGEGHLACLLCLCNLELLFALSV